MSSQGAYIGIEAVCSIIRQSSHLHFKIHNQKPNLKDKENKNLYLVKQYAEGKDKEQAILSFQDWASHHLKYSSKPDQLFYLEMYTHIIKGGRPGIRDPRGNPEVTCFKLSNEPGISEEEEITTSATVRPSEEYIQLRLQVERLQWEKEQLEAQLLDEADEDEDEDEPGSGSLFGVNLDSPIGKSIGEIISSFAQTMTKQALGGGNNPLMEALQTIKQTNPKTEAVLIKLAEHARLNPTELNEMINGLYNAYFPTNNVTNTDTTV